MSSSRIAIASVITTACIVWVLVAYMSWSIYTQAQQRATAIASGTNATARSAQAIQNVALAHAIAPGAARLDAISATDIVTTVDAINAVGNAAHVPLSISSAVPAPIPDPRAQVLLPSLHAYDVSIDARGSFADVMHLLYGLENLPILSSLLSVDIQSQPDASDTNKSAPWHINVRIRIFTTASV